MVEHRTTGKRKEWTCGHGYSESQHWVDGNYSCPHFRREASASSARACENCGEQRGEHETWCINAPTVPDVVTTTS